LIARRRDTLDASAAAVTGSINAGSVGLGLATAEGDAADPESLSRAWTLLADRLGPPSVVVYNAMAVVRGDPTTLDLSDFNATLAVNVTGALHCAQLAVPAMKAAGTGTVLFTGGGLALEPFPAAAALAAGKAGARNLGVSLALELEPAGIHVAVVTVCGRVEPGTAFDPDLIADVYWELHSQPPGSWERERIIS
jgi:NAD(P)-dependent dehydrogenase (short-subunit alcohol dehydrogenase family)